ncbi:hypothetical protein [Nostoc sp. UHCC 0251]|nr:hypothetical protein [Nostoc sp. UHCC 0251]
MAALLGYVVYRRRYRSFFYTSVGAIAIQPQQEGASRHFAFNLKFKI